MSSKNINKLAAAFVTAENVGVTENGAKSLKSTLKSTVDFFSKSAAYRRTPDAAIEPFRLALKEDSEVAMKTLFYTRDVRGGQGERETFRKILRDLVDRNPLLVLTNLSNIPFFGRWDDLFVLFGTELESDVIEYCKAQIEEDLFNVNDESASISLLGKWLPSINTSSKETCALAHKFAKSWGWTPKQYRKTLSALRKKLDVVERKMSDREFSVIDYSKVPANASLKYRKAFAKRDEVRYKAYLASVEKGEAKINAGTLYPYDICRNVTSAYDTEERTLDALWNALPDYLVDNPHNGLVLSDVSSSMDGTYGSTGTVRPIDVSLSLAVYIAERNKGAFKDYFLKFSTEAELCKVTGSTIKAKFNSVKASTNNWGSTNLQSGFESILSLAEKNNVPQEDMPSVIYIISDMQFDQACSSNKRTNFEQIQKKYAKAGYTMPKIVFWNVNASHGNDQPVQHDENGTALVSGCSPVILKTVLSGSTPEDVMKATVLVERYNKVAFN